MEGERKGGKEGQVRERGEEGVTCMTSPTINILTRVVYLLQLMNPSTHHNCPKSSLHQDSLLVLHILLGSDKYTKACILYFIIVSYRVVSLPQFSIFCLFILLSLPINPRQPLNILSCTQFYFLQSHIVVIIWYEAFSVWLLSLRSMHLKFVHGFSWLNSSFFQH